MNGKNLFITIILIFIILGGIALITNKLIRNSQEENKTRLAFSDCGEISNSLEKGSCWKEYALQENDLVMCAKIEEKDIRNSCFDEFDIDYSKTQFGSMTDEDWERSFE